MQLRNTLQSTLSDGGSWHTQAQPVGQQALPAHFSRSVLATASSRSRLAVGHSAVQMASSAYICGAGGRQRKCRCGQLRAAQHASLCTTCPIVGRQRTAPQQNVGPVGGRSPARSSSGSAHTPRHATGALPCNQAHSRSGGQQARQGSVTRSMPGSPVPAQATTAGRRSGPRPSHASHKCRLELTWRCK